MFFHPVSSEALVGWKAHSHKSVSLPSGFDQTFPNIRCISLLLYACENLETFWHGRGPKTTFSGLSSAVNVLGQT